MATEKKPSAIPQYQPSDIEAGETHNADVKSSHWLALAEKLSIETGGIQRVTDEECEHNATRVWNACTFWLSANMAVATLSTGMVGPSMGLAFWDSFAIIIIINLLSCLVPAFTATFGLTGLRMTTFSRYSFGYWGNLLVVVFSMVSTTGWNAINAISGASCLAALSNGTLPAWGGVVIITVSVWILCVLGISWIHRVDSYLWIPPLIVWCVAAGTGAKNLNGFAVESPVGESGAAKSLSFIAVVFSFAVSWTNCASDYNVKMPRTTPKWKLFVATYVGICAPAILVQTLGAALYSGAQMDQSWKNAYEVYGVGGPLKMALQPAGGFGKFLMVLAGLSSIPNNIPNNYSFALHAQNFGPWAMRVPRIAFVTLGFIVAIIVGCLASLSFESSLQTFLSIIGYWTIIHIVIVLEEHFIFRKCRCSMYDLSAWSDATVLPFGWGAISAFCFGFLGAALGMSVSWYTAPIAGLVGTGANIGFELTLGFSGLIFPLARWLEIRITGK
ncbi:cytosine-purine permease [Hortaea werneckii]|nr:cytosine-purine permease [Hortaea werneckii]